jgi:hypothetical protein
MPDVGGADLARRQMDVQAIMKGIGQARSSPNAGYEEDMPPP